MSFQIGEVVRLKSGGPNMTVTEVDREIWCTWFDKSKRCQDSFPASILEKVNPAKPSAELI